MVGHKQIEEKIVELNGNIRAINMEAFGRYHIHVRESVKTVADCTDGEKGNRLLPGRRTSIAVLEMMELLLLRHVVSVLTVRDKRRASPVPGPNGTTPRGGGASVPAG